MFAKTIRYIDPKILKTPDGDKAFCDLMGTSPQTVRQSFLNDLDKPSFRHTKWVFNRVAETTWECEGMRVALLPEYTEVVDLQNKQGSVRARPDGVFVFTNLKTAMMAAAVTKGTPLVTGLEVISKEPMLVPAPATELNLERCKDNLIQRYDAAGIPYVVSGYAVLVLGDSP